MKRLAVAALWLIACGGIAVIDADTSALADHACAHHADCGACRADDACMWLWQPHPQSPFLADAPALPRDGCFPVVGCGEGCRGDATCTTLVHDSNNCLTHCDGSSEELGFYCGDPFVELCD